MCLPFQPHGEYTVVGGVIFVIIPNNRCNIKTGDLERGLARIMMNRATGRDMVRKKVFDFVGYFDERMISSTSFQCIIFTDSINSFVFWDL